MAWRHRLSSRTRRLIATAAVLVTVGCGGDDAPSAGESTPPSSGSAPPPSASAEALAGDGLFPDVVAVVATQSSDETWRFDVTLSSPYDSPERYADAWRVLGPDGAELGIRELAHDHANEQPFTRSLSGVVIPATITTVTIEGRDQVNGWGGQTRELELPS